MKKSLAALAERWEARTATRQAAAARPSEAEPVAVEPSAALPPPPPAPPPPDAWGMSAAERAAALARMEAAAVAPAAPAPPEPAPPPALPWHAMPYGAERGHAFAEARRQPGACPHCAGRRWWCRAGATEEPTCSTCHPPPPGLAVEVSAAPTAGTTYTPEAPDALRDGLLDGFRGHRAAVKP